MGTEFDGDRLSRGINFMGIVSLGGQEVGDQKSGDQLGLGPNEAQPKIISRNCDFIQNLALLWHSLVRLNR